MQRFSSRWPDGPELCLSLLRLLSAGRCPLKNKCGRRLTGEVDLLDRLVLRAGRRPGRLHSELLLQPVQPLRVLAAALPCRRGVVHFCNTAFVPAPVIAHLVSLPAGLSGLQRSRQLQRLRILSSSLSDRRYRLVWP